jgi:hypothetical protein
VDDQGRIEVVRPGRHTIVVRFLTQVQAVQITAAYPAGSTRALGGNN